MTDAAAVAAGEDMNLEALDREGFRALAKEGKEKRNKQRRARNGL